MRSTSSVTDSTNFYERHSFDEHWDTIQKVMQRTQHARHKDVFEELTNDICRSKSIKYKRNKWQSIDQRFFSDAQR
jgi:hypothetical protein